MNYLEAAIVFARSVTFHVQKEHKHEIGFDAWYAECQRVLKADPVSTFFLNTRNFILKEGSITIHKVVNVSLQETIFFRETVRVKIMRGKPWYRRDPKIIWQDLQARILQPVHTWQQQREIHKRQEEVRQRETVEVNEEFYFINSPFDERPALELLYEYLNKLEQILDDAEARF